MLPEATQEFTIIPVKSPVAFFTEIGKKTTTTTLKLV